MMASSSEDQRREEEAAAAKEEEKMTEMVHKTKVIQFLGRTTPIILQNDNGPCPLLAICNVLLLKNNLNLSPDIPEVSQEKLLSLVAERLLDSNSNINNKDAGFVENQQQNIADAIDLLPRLTTGIDVNIKFRRIDDFEFTRECAIFDLLDIPLYHGWIVDPQDYDTANAIGSKSYNTLMGELVALETQNTGSESKKNSEEECVDFAAATTATLGVPSPCLSRGRSFEDSPRSASDDLKSRKGDLEEEEALLRALRMSEVEIPTSVDGVYGVNTSVDNLFANSNESTYLKKPESVVLVDKLEPLLSDESNALINLSNDIITSETVPGKEACLFSNNDQGNANFQSISEESGDCVVSKDIIEKANGDMSVKSEGVVSDSFGPDPSPMCENHIHNPGGDEHVKDQSTSTVNLNESKDNQSSGDALDFSHSVAPNAESVSTSGKGQSIDVPKSFTPGPDGGEPIYEGEECILEPGTTTYADREPMYEGEVVLAEQVEKDSKDACDTSSKDEITPKQGELIRNFLINSASQLTVYGLFRLQDGPKERELCVFFRNNHFSTMFKFEGELYLLATDQGYLNQSDLVWEKLNEVNGDTLFMTGNFKEFKVESPTNTTTWDEQNAMVNTADYLASIDNTAQAHSSFTSDLELAIALQQQEFEQQPRRNLEQPTVSGGSRLVTGPQVSRSSANHSSSSSRLEAKQSKDKCIVM
ncbi:hypothetical protein LguiB_034632 [Lonicera macranthoides]